MIRAIRGCGPIVGGAVVVRNAELAGPKNAYIRGRGIRTNDGCRPGCPQCGSPQGSPAAWDVLAEVDERPVFARRFPRSQNAVVRFYEPPTPSQQVRGCAPIVGGLIVVRNAEVRKRQGVAAAPRGLPVAH